MAEHKDGAFRAEVAVFGEANWASNALRFDSADEALEYARDLRSRWMMVDKIRAVPVTTPERQAIREDEGE